MAYVNHGMIRPEDRFRRGPQMSATPDTTLADPERVIANLQRQLAECKAEPDKAQGNLDETKTERDEALAERVAIAEVLQAAGDRPADRPALYPGGHGEFPISAQGGPETGPPRRGPQANRPSLHNGTIRIVRVPTSSAACSCKRASSGGLSAAAGNFLAADLSAFVEVTFS
jgi:hypothetical protein